MPQATPFPSADGAPEPLRDASAFDVGDHDVIGELRAQPEFPDFIAIAESAKFQELRGRLRRFVFPMSAVFLAWYLTYVIVAAYAPGFMSIRLFGEVNIGLLMGLSQFVSTITITALYQRFARRCIDPRVRELRQDVLGGEAG